MLQFAPHENVRDGFIRICGGLIESALDRIARPGGNRARDLHQVRVTIKRLRAMLRLVRPAISKAFFKRENARLRKTAKELSVFRDPMVSRQILKKMLKKAPGESDRTASRKVVAAVLREHRPNRQFRMEREGAMRRAARRLERTFRAFQSLVIPADDWQAVGAGLRKVYRAARNRMLRALADGGDEAFHDWRKQAKYLYYQFQTINPVWPDRLGRMNKRLRRLEQHLGIDHDLTVLKGPLMRSPKRYGGAAAVKRLVARLDEQRALLREECESLGKKLFSERPRKLARRLGRRWSAWREQTHNS